jgi:two-component system chemotaxis response regulator CheB
MTPPRIRVLVVDDSAFARKVLSESLRVNPLVQVIGTARDGLEALEKIAALKPDVVTLDLVMPNLDGIGVLRALDPLRGPRVVVVSISDQNSDLGLEALQAGAIDIVHKPTALATDRLFELSTELGTKVVAAATAGRARLSTSSSPATVHPANRAPAGAIRLVVIGTSTGGPQALSRLIPAFRADFPTPIVVALHIPAGYTEALARRLHENSPLEVVEAGDETELRPGLVVIARGGSHLTIANRRGKHVARTHDALVTSLYSPSVDRLFESAATEYRNGVLGVVLTGMGDDGLVGSRAIRAAGGSVITESESTSVVYGMPRAVRDAGLAVAEAPLHEMAKEIASRV